MELGTVVAERYELAELLGQGGTGAVFRALDLETREDVAIKILRPASLAYGTDAVERFIREGEALGRLNHPNIVRRLAFVQDDHRHYLVMELMERGSLEKLLSRDAPMPIERVLALALDLSDALARVHRLEIIHRDLKPANVLIANDGTPRLSDFGVAYFAEEQRLSGSNGIVGTLEYLSPEVLGGGVCVDARSDIWAFGVLLFEMLAGRVPFRAEHPAGTLQAILLAAPPDLELLRPDCPIELVDLVYRMLEKDRHRRTPSARRIGAELESILARERSESGGPSVVSQRKRDAVRAQETCIAPHDRPLAEPALPQELPATPAWLPQQTTPFVGREHELAQMAKHLLDPAVRLLTIVGPGGIGKTRIAFEAARQLMAGIDAFAVTVATEADLPRELRFVELGPLANVEQVLPTIAEAVGFRFQPGSDSKSQLLAFLRAKRLLLLLDNFEHVLGAASLVHDVLQEAPHVKVLVTSRERLMLSVECVFALSGLDVPDLHSLSRASEFSGVRLFAESARRVRLDFELSGQVLGEVVRVCHLVQGLPLGIVLAAAWVTMLTPREIGDEIAKGFDFLSTELRDVPDRQHSLRTVFDHSYALLKPDERAIFVGLSLFKGGFSRAAAECVAGASLRALAALMNQSLVTRDPASGRYSMHELLRQYAEERLRASRLEYARIAEAHARYYAAFLGERTDAFKGKLPQLAALEIEGEIDNVRAAWARLLETRDDGAASIALETLGLFHAFRSSFLEAEQTFRTAAEQLAGAEAVSPAGTLLARALTLQAQACSDQWHHAEAAELAARARGLLDESSQPGEVAHALLLWAISSFWLGNVQDGLEGSELSEHLFRRAGRRWERARALTLLARCQNWLGLPKAEGYLRESLELQRSLGDGNPVTGDTLADLGNILAEQGQYAEGCRMMLEGLALLEANGDSWSKVLRLQNLVSAQRRRGDLADAEVHARRGLALSRRAFPFAETWSHTALADVLKEQGQLDAAAEHLHAAMLDHNPLSTAFALMNLGDIALLRGDLAEAGPAFLRSLSEFERLGESAGIIIACDYLGYLACIEARFAEAAAYFQRALALSLVRRQLPLATNILAGMAFLTARQGGSERAVELLSLVESHPITESQTIARRVRPLLAELASALPVATFETAVQRGRALKLEQVLREPTAL